MADMTMDQRLMAPVKVVSAGPSPPSNAYVAEDGTTYYVAEDGATYYVQES